jgi:hypothetical protein
MLDIYGFLKQYQKSDTREESNNGSIMYDCHSKSMESWVETYNFGFCLTSLQCDGK